MTYPIAFEAYMEARAIHAFLLRCEGLTYQQIGSRMYNTQGSTCKKTTIGSNSAMLLVRKGTKRINRAMRKTRFQWVEFQWIDENSSNNNNSPLWYWG
jgi:hypothetical protein